jgi:16S rRNA (cytosine967-C5)-methyltransferase
LNQENISYVLDNFSAEDRGFFTKVLNHTIRNHVKIDYILKKLIKNFKSLPPASKTFLRLGVSQLLLGIDEYAAVNETVNLVKNKKQKNFINAVLRNFIRQKDQLLSDLPENVKYSYPKWIYDKISFLNHREDILKKHASEPNITIRINTLKTTKDELIAKLKDLGVDVEESKHFDNSLIVKNNKDILLLNNLFDEGYYYVQNESSQLVSHILNPNTGDKVLDTCSAPGGKTTHLAEIMNNNGIIKAYENDIIRLEKVKNNSKKLGINIIETYLNDSSEVVLDEKYDKILIDAPCTSAGISSIHPEVLLRLDEKNINLYSKIQKDILRNILTQVEKGTEIVFSTCTLFEEENTKNMKYIKKNFDVEFVDFKEQLKNYNIKSQYDGYGHYIIPDEYLIPFYITKIVKK